MQQFIEKFGDRISAPLSGFDRLVLRASPRRLNISYYDHERGIVVAKGMQEYLYQNHILFKDYGQHVKKVSERVKEQAVKPLKEEGLPVLFLNGAEVDKGLLARQMAQERGISSGLVCGFSTMEPGPTFDYVKSKIARRRRPCHVLYQYRLDEQFGWMYARIQTWFPFEIQIGMNGREWLSRQMSRDGLKYVQAGNCFPWIEDYPRAQELMNRQLETNWTEVLSGFARQLNPLHEEIFAKYPTENYWTCHQSEWATDFVFRDADDLKRWMGVLMPHGMLTFHSADVLRFFG